MSDRARQFAPFSALKGFHELIKQKERVITIKKELSEDDLLKLSEKMMSIEKGNMAKIVHFCEGEYISTEGIVTDIDTIYRTITIVKRKIRFADIIDILCE